jgi:hypothetical protein
MHITTGWRLKATDILEAIFNCHFSTYDSLATHFHQRGIVVERPNNVTRKFWRFGNKFQSTEFLRIRSDNHLESLS